VRTGALRRRGWCLYLVKCADRSLYTGITNDLQRRIAQHNSGTASRYTRSRLPVELVYCEGCRDKSGALKKEYRVKSLSRRAKEAYIAKKTRAATQARSRAAARRVTPPAP
jgi:predicted GIY-YIG superfamily endonuclease